MSAPQAGDASALPGPLHGLRVLELADEKGQFCGKLMADLGADVIKIEPPGGQRTRLVGPFLDDIPHRERSLFFWHYNTSKRGITLNLEHPEGQAMLRRLVPTADIMLETYPPGYLPALGLGYDVLSSLESPPHRVLLDTVWADRPLARFFICRLVATRRRWPDVLLWL